MNMEMIEEAQVKAGFFDENMIWADFDKIPELRLIDFLTAAIAYFGIGKLFEYEVVDLLVASCGDNESKEKLTSTIMKILFMIHPN